MEIDAVQVQAENVPVPDSDGEDWIFGVEDGDGPCERCGDSERVMMSEEEEITCYDTIRGGRPCPACCEFETNEGMIEFEVDSDDEEEDTFELEMMRIEYLYGKVVHPGPLGTRKQLIPRSAKKRDFWKNY